ncbi:MAG: TM2 domain-containing protein [Erysipelotrichaceae bacterium]|jgi:TM2 domain-containing membrane protein YozV|nr:TM2 domain-containing protein [Erysipelotrichaceae bacterium]
MYCSNCGKEIPNDAKFCPFCGVPVTSSETVEAEVVGSKVHPEAKSAVAAGLLGILLGVYGVHNFYLGYKDKAIVQLILGLTIIGAPISAIWGLIEGILILVGEIKVDGYGNPIKKDF